MKSSHGCNCQCNRHIHVPFCLLQHDYHADNCGKKNGNAQLYQSAANWSWQNNLELGLWKTETYECFTQKITVVRTVPVEVADFIRKYGKSSSDIEKSPRLLTHFDFEITTYVRRLSQFPFGRAWSWNPLMPPKPPEIRRKMDTGYLIGRGDTFTFCVSCCTEKIDWPKGRTRTLQEEADVQVSLCEFHHFVI